MKQIKYAVRFRYNLEESKFKDFLDAIKPYRDCLDVTDFCTRYVDGGKKPMSSIKTEVKVRDKIRNILYPDKEFSTAYLFKRLKLKSHYYDSYRTFARLLFQMCAEDILEVEKLNKKNGGFENVWSLNLGQ